ncbi:LysR family transcriptional regulator [Pseudodesulfovibrio senegalensis]|jgi:DNA-binding transcriptional LysR family regulator|uniref:LysR family transcriptional regulator n=1 Tax=Pseudodesulfovibrio senegalensis TaxID=1721087 RepID=A0A6N6N4I8_9BACT|nr:LysR family transcriptional regulator [Pseudodesulfovibrio senegalensis]KAB1442698.1 LysR family transcriptional regulator [Pseudodesulfovibrio senegalensis]
MELYHLRSFVAVAEEGHLTNAAKRLHTSQPTVSAHIKALEENLEVKLFSRTPKGMILTEAGDILKAQARKVLAAVDEFQTRAVRLRADLAGAVRIGLNTDSEYLRLTDLISAVSEKHPGLELHLTQNSSDRILEAIRAEELDAGFVFYENPYSDIKAHALRRSRVLIVAPAEWEERVQDASFEELAKMPWVWPARYCPLGALVLDHFESRGFCPARTIRADSEDVIRRLVVGGKGLSIMREDEAEALRAEGKLVCWQTDQNQDIGMDIFFVYHRDRKDDPVILAMLEAVERVWKTEA